MKKLLLTLSLAAVCAVASAKIQMPDIFGDNMVLQRGKPVKVWGTSDASAKVDVAFGKQTVSTKADENGNWSVSLKPMKAAKTPRELNVSENGKLDKSFKNVLVGEVWILGGQSNMEYPIKGWNPPNPDAENVKARANYPLMREISVSGFSRDKEMKNIKSPSKGWRETTPENVLKYSAVGFNFSELLMKDLDVPVAMIYTPLGGSQMCAWIPASDIKKLEFLAQNYERFQKEVQNYDYKKAVEAHKAAVEKYHADKKAGKKVPSRPPFAPLADTPRRWQDSPCGLYNARIAPIGGFTARGVLWYQGESDSWTAAEHFEDIFKIMVNSWRNLWKDQSLWFLQVQLTSFETKTHWGQVRQAQFAATKSLKNCGIVNIIDLGDKTDIHPLNKKDVGKRLENLAMRKVYKKRGLPNYNTFFYKCKFEKNKATLSLDKSCAKERINSRGELRGVEVKVGDAWRAAKNVRLVGNKLIVSDTDSIDGVRYLWKNWANDDICLFNSSSIPVFPFVFENTKK